MRATLPFLKQRFDHFNALCFNRALPDLPFKLSTAKNVMGAFHHVVCRRPWGETRRCWISISTRFDLQQPELEDILIHEMIHYYIWHHRICDTSPHGHEFLRMMHSINIRHKRNISVRHHTSAEQLASDSKVKLHYICVTEWENGARHITLCARTRIFEVHGLFSAAPQVKRVEWYVSTDVWFNRYPVSRTAKAYIISAEDYAAHMADAKTCVCDGHAFHLSPAR